MESLEKIRSELQARISKCNRIILGLQSYDPFLEMLSDFKDQMKRLDESWQWITDPKLLSESQITKMAYLSIINCLDIYRHDMEEADKQIVELENPDKIVPKDFDNEVVSITPQKTARKTRKKNG
jgi:hypothetical protein